MRQTFIPLVVSLLQSLSAQTLITHTYGGSGSDAANSVTTDSAGNIYIAGTTTSFDLPLTNPAQSVNSGTQLLYSTNAGFTWKPLGNLPDAYKPYQLSQPMPIAVDPVNPDVFYLIGNDLLYKTTDGGQHFTTSSALMPVGYWETTILIDPSNPSTLYSDTPVPGGIFKSTDGGATWFGAILGLPADSIGPMAIDPFHPQSLWLTVNGLGFMSTDGANSWSQVSLPGPAANGGVVQFVFDAVKPGTLYAFGRQNATPPFLLKSTDGGVTWSQLSAPFPSLGPLVADPVRAGHLYLLSSPGFFSRTTDGGITWQSFPFPGGFVSAMAVDPGNPNIILAGSYRSNNGGETWSPTMASRDIQMTFAPSGKDLVYASGPLTSDAFLAKFKPDGKTLEFATYFGGMGNETVSSVQLDASGNIWMAGTTSSFDLPGSQHGALPQLKGLTNIFVAKFSPQGQLLASTYLGGHNTETVACLRLDANGDPWIFGETTSADFPFKNGSPGLLASLDNIFLAKINSSESQLLYAAPISGVNQAGGMSIDSADNIILAGSTYSSGFATTPGVVHGISPPGPTSEQAFVIKLDQQGNPIFSTYLGGSMGADGSGIAVQFGNELDNVGVAVATDQTGIYVTGNTSAAGFPTTPGAFQTKLKGSGCSYPAYAYDTGLIGTIYSYLVDDVFVTKLSPDGRTMIYSTLLGGSCYDRPTDIAVTTSGAVFVAGETDSVDFPQVHPEHGAPAVQTYKSFVSMLSPTGAALAYSSYLSAGSSPRLALGAGGILEIAGDIGSDAQTMTYTGFPNPPANPLTKVALASLNASAAPAALDLTGALNAFSLLPGPIAAGENVELTVPDFKPAQTINIGINERLPLGTSLGDTQVLFDGKPVPMIAISTGTIECIAPQDFGTNTSTAIQVNANGTLSNTLQEDVAPAALGLLSADGSGTGFANARNQDGTLNSAANPAKRGSRVTLFVTGAGVPPTALATNYPGTVTVEPLRGFVPGIYSATFEIPSDTNFPSPLGVTLNAPGGSILVPGSSSQSLLVHVQ